MPHYHGKHVGECGQVEASVFAHQVTTAAVKACAAPAMHERRACLYCGENDRGEGLGRLPPVIVVTGKPDDIVIAAQLPRRARELNRTSDRVLADRASHFGAKPLDILRHWICPLRRADDEHTKWLTGRGRCNLQVERSRGNHLAAATRTSAQQESTGVRGKLQICGTHLSCLIRSYGSRGVA